MFFLTAVDTEHLDIRGSRDPLGLVPLWGSFGRKVVGNLTTASDSVRGFTTLLLGLYFAERVSAGKDDREQVRLAAFLKLEQIAGFARVLRNDDGAMRGITQIRRRLEESGGRRVRIGAARDLQILSNQKTYGLWGLFTMPAIESGLVVPKELSLSVEGREIVERRYLPIFKARGLGEGQRLEDILAKKDAELEPTGKDSKLFDAIAEILKPGLSAVERTFYHRHLVRGGPSAERGSWQPRFSELMESAVPAKGDFTHDSLKRIIAAASSPGDAAIKTHLLRIRDLEALLSAMTNLFGFLQQRANGTVRDICSELEEAWPKGLPHVRPAEISDMRTDVAAVYGEGAAADRLVRLADSLCSADYKQSIDLVLAHNQFVMATRSGSQPWIQRTGEQLEVRYADETETRLLSETDLSRRWQSSFYIDPLKTVSDELRAGG